MTAQIISVGTELLLGDILNTNAQFLSRELAALGIVLKAERLPLNIGIGICLGMTPLVAYN